MSQMKNEFFREQEGDILSYTKIQNSKAAYIHTIGGAVHIILPTHDIKLFPESILYEEDSDFIKAIPFKKIEYVEYQL